MSVNADTGKQLSNSQKGERAGTHLTIFNKTIYFGGWRKKGVLLLMQKHAERWEADTDSVCGSTVIADKMLYVTCSDKRLYALDAETGEKGVGDKSL